MFTWNLQFVSQKRLEDTLYQFIPRKNSAPGRRISCQHH